MEERIGKLGLTFGAAVLLLVLAGCSSVVQRGPIEEISVPPVSTQPPESAPPRSQQPSSGISAAVAELLTTGWQQLDDGELRAALSSAERAQRLDRFNPEIYLLIATAHYRTAALPLANNIARQGQSYAAAGSAIANRLEALLAVINTP